ncbi:MAG: G8 domain-containing protein, partial [Planctomycetota bacterium]
MILRPTSKRNVRKKQRQRKQLNFQLLEGRKLMAGDLMASMNHGPGTEMHAPTMNMDSGGGHHCSGHTHTNPAMMALVTDAQATHVTVGTGNWSDPAVWQNGVVPSHGARVVVGQGHTLTVDRVFNEELKTVRIDGTLKFATNVNTQLKVDTMVSMACGRLEMGTAANRIDAGVTAKLIIADDGAIDRNWDPTQLSRGLLLMGSSEFAGAQTTDKLTLATQPTRGTRTLQLSAVPTNWKAGDEIVITGTQGATSDEVRTISSVNGTNVVLNQALQLDHITPKQGLDVYVANKTRNVEIRSENTSTPRRGHVMFMHTHHVKIDNAGFYDLGRTDKSQDLDDVFFEFTEDAVGNEAGAPTVYTVEVEPEANNIRGRYAMHFHRGGVDPNSMPATVHGSVVD